MDHHLGELFDILGAKTEPNEHEKILIERAKKYIGFLTWIPGLEMIAICNSLAFYATHRDSDIDLFIITRPRYIYLVRFFTTVTFYLLGVWRHGEDIRENFCLSFFITEDAMNLEPIAIEEDIYLRGWIKSLKPILVRENIYERFITDNSWIRFSSQEKKENIQYITYNLKKEYLFLETIWISLNHLLGKLMKRKALKKYNRLGNPWGVIISDEVLKFHDNDQRKIIRDRILEKNFDK